MPSFFVDMAIMKTRSLVLAVISLFMFAGCATTHEPAYSTVLEGMTRNVLRFNFGESLRIEPRASGGEDWCYRFSSWQTQPTGSTSTSNEFGERTSSVNAGLNFSKQVVERPVHLSSDGFVVPPLPEGKVVKN